MELVYDLWHLAFVNLIEQRAPPSFEVQSEVRLSIEPQRADLLLLRRLGTPRKDEVARVLHWIWPRLAKVTVVEFKSPSKSSFHRGDLVRLWGYGPLYQATHIAEVPLRSDLTLLLVIPSLTPSLLEEIAAMGWTLSDLGGGYRRIDGAVYDLYVAVTDEVADAERDEFLRLFSRHHVTDPAATWWLQHWITERRTMKQNVEDIPGYEEMWQKIVDGAPLKVRLLGLPPEQVLSSFPAEQRLAGLPPEQRLAGLAPEQRLVGLAPEQRLVGLSLEQQLLALSDEVLRGLPDAYVSSLPPEVQQAIRKRIGRPGPTD
jgi:hypothetical protein